MRPDEYLQYDGIALASLLACGDVRPVDLMHAAIGLARARAPSLNALCHDRYDDALAWADQWTLQGPFGGIPFLLKDSGLASTRLRSSIGSRLFRDMAFAQNATVVDRFEQAGLIPFARTAVPELCMAPTTEALANPGPTRNPWDLSRSTGGSSGGAAAAVAAGIVPIAHGSDGAGSIRIPAACCGLYGLKPSRGMVPVGPSRGEVWGGMAGDGVLSRTVRDSAAALDAIAGAEPGAPYAAPARSESFLQTLATPRRRPLRIGVWRQAWIDIPIESACLDAVEHAALLCRHLGHDMVDIAPPALDYSGFIDAHITVLATNIVMSAEARLRVLGRTLREDDLEPALLDGYRLGKALGATHYAQAIQCFHAVGRSMDTAMGDCDLLLSPTLTRVAPPLGTYPMTGTLTAFRHTAARFGTFMAVVNASGQPAASVPLWQSQDGLPVGIQLIGRLGRDDQVLKLSAELESIDPWIKRRPTPPTDDPARH